MDLCGNLRRCGVDFVVYSASEEERVCLEFPRFQSWRGVIDERELLKKLHITFLKVRGDSFGI